MELKTVGNFKTVSGYKDFDEDLPKLKKPNILILGLERFANSFMKGTFKTEKDFNRMEELELEISRVRDSARRFTEGTGVLIREPDNFGPKAAELKVVAGRVMPNEKIAGDPENLQIKINQLKDELLGIYGKYEKK
jgi:hypothetical protein